MSVRIPGGTAIWVTYKGSRTTATPSALYAAYQAGTLSDYQVYTTSHPDTPCSPSVIGSVEEDQSELCITAKTISGRSVTVHASGLIVDRKIGKNPEYCVNNVSQAHYFCGTISGAKHEIKDRVIESCEFHGSDMTYIIPVDMALSRDYALICGT